MNLITVINDGEIIGNYWENLAAAEYNNSDYQPGKVGQTRFSEQKTAYHKE